MVNPLSIPNNKRGIITGRTGTGKTTVSKVIMAEKKFLLVIDPKREFETFQEYEIVNEPQQLEETARKTKNEKAIIYRPLPENIDNYEFYNLCLKWAFLRENTFVYIDELLSVVRNPMSYPSYLRAIYTQGRSKNVGILSATQRPANIPMFTKSECEYFWKFQLTLPKDQIAMSEYMGEEVIEPDEFPKKSVHSSPYSFYFYTLGMEKTKEYVLEMKGN